MGTILVNALGIVFHGFLLFLPQGLPHRDPDALKNILVLRECFGALAKQQRGFPTDSSISRLVWLGICFCKIQSWFQKL